MKANTDDVPGWDTTYLSTTNEVLDLLKLLDNNDWITRGQSQCWEKLIPKIDRPPFNKLTSRSEKLELERHSIELLQSKVNFLSAQEESVNLNHDMNTLMVFQHFNGPTRLLDWSKSPYIATYFSISKDQGCDGELWTFQNTKYEEFGGKQWRKFEGVPLHSPINVRYNYAFSKNTPSPDFFICVHNYIPFMRMIVQKGLFTMTASFGTDHANVLRLLFEENRNYYHRYIIPSNIKAKVKRTLCNDFRISKAVLFPNTENIVRRINKKLLETI
jgi:hypothetical protein